MSEVATAEFGQLLREHRLAARLTQEALAARAGMGVRSIQALERGESKPLQDTLQRLVAALALTPEQRIPFTAVARPSPRQRMPVTPNGAVLTSQRPPSHAPSAVRSGQRLILPAPLTSFVGRDRESAEVIGLLERTRLLTLTGPGGTGKTRLALHVAATAHDRFSDGVVFVSLASILDPGLVPVTIATALGVQQGDDPSLTRALIAHLHAQRLLLVLDNFEHVVAATPLVAELLSGCPNLGVLVTSRMPLHLSGEQEYAVPPLALPAGDAAAPGIVHVRPSPAVDLFVQRAQLVRPDFALTAENAPVVGDICRRLDGLPLAIELAAARVKLLAPADLLARLGQSLQVLTGGPHDRPAHQQTMRGTMDWSYDLLQPSEQLLFCRLAVFAGGWTFEAAEAVCNGDDLDGAVLETLASLVDKSLLVVDAGAEGHTRYGMLETIRVYALERLAAGGEAEEMQRRHARYFQQFAERAAPEPGRKVNLAWLEWSKREQDNLRAAGQWAHGHGEAELEMRLLVPLIGCWYALRQLHEAQHQLERLHGLQERYRDRVPADLLVQALTALSGILWQSGEYERGKALMEECVARCRAAGLHIPLRASLQLLGHITCEMREYEQAAALYQESLALAQEAGDTLGVVRALLGLGDVARGLGDAAEIVARCEEALALSRARGDTEQEAFALHNLGIAAWLQHDLARAKALLRDSLALVREDGYPPAIAEVLTSLGRVERAQGHLEQARSTLTESLILAREGGPYFIVADDLEELAGLAALEHQTDLAARLLGAAQALRQAKCMRPRGLGQRRHECAVAEVRAVLGDAAFEAAYAAGQAMGREEAVALALEERISAMPAC